MNAQTDEFMKLFEKFKCQIVGVDKHIYDYQIIKSRMTALFRRFPRLNDKHSFANLHEIHNLYYLVRRQSLQGLELAIPSDWCTNELRATIEDLAEFRKDYVKVVTPKYNVRSHRKGWPLGAVACPICAAEGWVTHLDPFDHRKYSVLCTQCLGKGWIDPKKLSDML